MTETPPLPRHPALRALRAASTVALGVAVAGAWLATLSERSVVDVAGLRIRTLHLTDAWTACAGAVLLRWLLSEGALTALGAVRRRAAAAVPGRGGRVLLGLVLLNLLVLPHSVGHGVAQALKARAVEWEPLSAMPPRYGVWESRNVDPIILEARRRILPTERVLLIGPGLREFERYQIAYVLFPRLVFLHPADEERLTLRHTPFAAERQPTIPEPDGAEYLDFARRRGIEWVIRRDGEDPTETTILRMERAFGR